MKRYSTLIKTLALFIFILSFTGRSYAQMTNLLWAEHYGNTGSTDATTMAIDGEGNVYMAGVISDTLPVSFDNFSVLNTRQNSFFIAKFDAAGNLLWAKNIGSGNGYNSSSGLVTDNSGHLYLVGSFAADTFFLPADTLYNTAGVADSFNNTGNTLIMKLDTSGNLLWAENFGGLFSENGATAISITSSGDFYVLGSFGGDSLSLGTITVYGAHGNFENEGGNYVAKFDTSGNVIWAKSFDANESSIAYSITGKVAVTGYTYNDSLFAGSKIALNPLGTEHLNSICFDTLGNVLWAQFMGGDSSWGSGNAIVADEYGNFYITGGFLDSSITFSDSTFINDSAHNGADIFLIKLDQNGNVLWARHAGGTLLDEGSYLSVDASNVYLAGITQSKTLYFYGATDSVYHGYAGGYVVFVAKYDSSGNLQWVDNSQGNEDQPVYGIVTDGLGNAYIEGNFSGYIGFDSLFGNSQQFDSVILYNASNSGVNSNVFIAKFGPFNAAGIEAANQQQLSVFPNPTNKLVYTCGLPIRSAIQIYDVTGRLFLNTETQSETTILDLSSYPAGVYILNTPEGTRKIVKM